MPIKPENKARYSKDWPQIRLRILDRARYVCEHPGCKAAHGFKGYWRDGERRGRASGSRATHEILRSDE